MALIPSARKMMQTADAAFRSAVSESLLYRFAQAINFINERQHSEKQYFINGNLGAVAMPFNAIDGFTFFQYDAEIIDAWMYVQTCGTSGTLELDIKRATTPGGAFTSIFSTTPKITYSAGSNVWIHLGSALANTTAPVLSTTNVNTGDAIRCDAIQTQVGPNFNGCGIIIHYRPR